MLEIIRQKNLYALPVGTDGQWLRYHHLFRDYLQERYRREFPQEVAPMLAAAGRRSASSRANGRRRTSSTSNWEIRRRWPT